MMVMPVTEFADHPVLTVLCCGQAMEVYHSAHSREGGSTVHRIARGCRLCGATVITSYGHRAP